MLESAPMSQLCSILILQVWLFYWKFSDLKNYVVHCDPAQTGDTDLILQLLSKLDQGNLILYKFLAHKNSCEAYKVQSSS